MTPTDCHFCGGEMISHLRSVIINLRVRDRVDIDKCYVVCDRSRTIRMIHHDDRECWRSIIICHWSNIIILIGRVLVFLEKVAGPEEKRFVERRPQWRRRGRRRSRGAFDQTEVVIVVETTERNSLGENSEIFRSQSGRAQTHFERR